MAVLSGPEHLCALHARVFFIVDHATNAQPRDAAAFGGDLGVQEAVWTSHAAWDIGAAALTQALAERYGAAWFGAAFSRLYIDPNRPADAPDAIPQQAEGVMIPGNQALSAASKSAREDRLHAPYHSALSEALDAVHAAHHDPLIISVHSFTPVYGGEARPWPVGVLWDDHAASAKGLIAALEAADLGGPIGDNEPYPGRHYSHTMKTHVVPRDLRHVTLEVRQDLIMDAAGVARMAPLIFEALRPLVVEPVQGQRPALNGPR